MRRHPLALTLAIGCSGSQSAPPPPSEEALRISEPVLFRVDNAKRERIEDGGVLRSGDAISIEVAANRRAYVYVLQRHDDGSVDVLVPAPNEDLVQAEPHQLTTLPPPTSKFDMALDDRPGNDTLYVVASLRPLDIVLEGDTPPPPTVDAGVEPAPVDAGSPADAGLPVVPKKTQTLVRKPPRVGGTSLIGGYSNGFAKKGVVLKPKANDRWRLTVEAPDSDGVIVRAIHFRHQ